MPNSSAPRFNFALYIALVALTALAAYVYSLRKDGIFACPANGYGTDTFLAYCEASQYGDYDHGALWFGLEPGVQRSLAGAQALFLGNSRMQFGFSSDVTRSWFAAAGAPFYLMGFAYWENYQFEWPLLKRIQPRPRIYIVNLDLFFGTVESGPATVVMREADAASRYRRKKVWQIAHRVTCGSATFLCGQRETFFRSASTGEYIRSGGTTAHEGVSYDMQPDANVVADYVKRGRPFFDSLPVRRECILLTIVPSKDTHYASAKAIADELDYPFIAPQLTDLTMFDRAHLDRPSADRWSQAFLEAAGARIRGCLGQNAGAG